MWRGGGGGGGRGKGVKFLGQPTVLEFNSSASARLSATSLISVSQCVPLSSSVRLSVSQCVPL